MDELEFIKKTIHDHMQPTDLARTEFYSHHWGEYIKIPGYPGIVNIQGYWFWYEITDHLFERLIGPMNVNEMIGFLCYKIQTQGLEEYHMDGHKFFELSDNSFHNMHEIELYLERMKNYKEINVDIDIESVSLFYGHMTGKRKHAFIQAFNEAKMELKYYSNNYKRITKSEKNRPKEDFMSVGQFLSLNELTQLMTILKLAMRYTKLHNKVFMDAWQIYYLPHTTCLYLLYLAYSDKYQDQYIRICGIQPGSDASKWFINTLDYLKECCQDWKYTITF